MSQYHDKLVYVDDDYYKLNRKFLSIVKLWPYEQSMYAKINRVFIFMMLLSTVIVQLTTFLTFKFTVDLLVMVLSFAVPCFLCTMQYYLFYLNIDKVKQIWERISDDIDTLEDEKERKIIQRYSHIAKYSTISLTVFVMMGLIAYVFLELSPIILDIVLPLREIRPRKLLALTEYFVDYRIYFYAILCHWLIGAFLNSIVTLSISMFQMMHIHHICGLLKIVCYRIEHSIDKYATHYPKMKDRMMVQSISNIVKIHRKALKQADFWISAFSSISIANILLIVTSISLNLFRLLKSIILLQNDIQNIQGVKEIGISTMLIIVQFLMMFLGYNYPQKITDHHNELSKNVYNVQWYKAPIKMQKLLLFIMTKTTRTYTLNINNIVVGSLESVTKITNVSLSYFMVLYSLLI